MKEENFPGELLLGVNYDDPYCVQQGSDFRTLCSHKEMTSTAAAFNEKKEQSYVEIN
jgi:hypothetical protein